MENLKAGTDVLFVLMGAIMVLAMHSGFAFLELGTVRKKNQVNALVKILADFAVSTMAYFFVGYLVAYGTGFFASAPELRAEKRLRAGQVLLSADLRGSRSRDRLRRHRRARELLSAACGHGLVWSRFIYPFFEGIVWNDRFGLQGWMEGAVRREVSRFRGLGGGAHRGRMARACRGAAAGRAPRPLHARMARWSRTRRRAFPFWPSGAWVLTVGWFGFNVMSAQTIDKISGLVAVNSLMAMAGGTIAALLLGRNDPGFVYNGPLAGLVAVCAGSDVMHPLGALVTGAVAGALFVSMFTRDRRTLEDRRCARCVAAARAVRCLGRHRRGIFGATALGGLGGVSFGGAARGHAARHRDRSGRRLHRLWRAAGDGRHPARPRGGVQGRRPRDPPDRCDTGTGIGMVTTRLACVRARGDDRRRHDRRARVDWSQRRSGCSARTSTQQRWPGRRWAGTCASASSATCCSRIGRPPRIALRPCGSRPVPGPGCSDPAAGRGVSSGVPRPLNPPGEPRPRTPFQTGVRSLRQRIIARPDRYNTRPLP